MKKSFLFLFIFCGLILSLAFKIVLNKEFFIIQRTANKSNKIYFYESGGVKKNISIQQNKKNGKAYEYYENGFIKSIIEYKDDTINGLIFKFSIQGIIIRKASYRSGSLNGEVVNYYDTTCVNEVKSILNYTNDKLIGEQKYFRNNTIIKSEIMKKGTLKNIYFDKNISEFEKQKIKRKQYEDLSVNTNTVKFYELGKKVKEEFYSSDYYDLYFYYDSLVKEMPPLVEKFTQKMDSAFIYDGNEKVIQILKYK